jgi:predicted NBD/HSP70 family sugar kinase
MPRASAQTPKQLRQSNRLDVLRLVRRGAIARSELAVRTGLTRASMSLIVGEMIAEGLLAECGLRQSVAGRKPVLVELVPAYACELGLNLSRDGAKAGLLDLRGGVLAQEEVSLDGASRAADLRRLRAALKRMLSHRPAAARLLGLGISVPGPVDIARGQILNPPNFDLWHGAELAREFDALAPGRVYVENNATALTMAEQAYGAGGGSFLMLVVENGVGGGLVWGDQLYRGWNGFGGEIGHTSIDFNGPRCSCGLNGCVELYASVPHLLKRARALSLRARTWCDLASSGESAARELVEEQARALAVAAVNSLNVLELDAIILGGAVVDGGETLRSAMEDHVNRMAINRRLRRIAVRLSALGGKAPLMAAAAIVTERFFQGELRPPESR